MRKAFEDEKDRIYDEMKNQKKWGERVIFEKWEIRKWNFFYLLIYNFTLTV